MECSLGADVSFKYGSSDHTLIFQGLAEDRERHRDPCGKFSLKRAKIRISVIIVTGSYAQQTVAQLQSLH